MAIFASNLMSNGALVRRATREGTLNEFTGKIVVKSGTAVDAGSTFVIGRLASNHLVKSITIQSSALDNATTLTATAGYLKPTVDPFLAYNASTNPYTDDAVATADPDAYAVTGTIQGILRAGGVLTVTPAVAPVSGVVDVALTIVLAPASDPATDRTLTVTVEYMGPLPTPGETSGADAYTYTETFYT